MKSQLRTRHTVGILYDADRAGLGRGSGIGGQARVLREFMSVPGLRVGLLLVFVSAFTPPASAVWWLKRDRDLPNPATLEQLEARLQPYRTDVVTLSRDGRHLAYTVTGATNSSVDVVSIDDPSLVRHYNFGDLKGARVLALLWTSPERLAVNLENGVIAALDLPDAGIRPLLDPARFAFERVELPDATSLSEADAAGSSAVGMESWEIARWPRLLGTALGEPDVLLVQGAAGTSLENAVVETGRLDVRTGRLSFLDNVRVRDPGTRLWTDRQGRLRVIETRPSFPLKWRVRPDPNARWRAWRALEDVVAEEEVRAFAITAERLLEGRSFPLAFGRDPNRLYFASNVGRATFGIYELDLSTGRRTAFALEDPNLDLARPLADAPAGGIGRHDRYHRQINAAAHHTDSTSRPVDTPLVFDRASGELVGLRIDAVNASDRWLDPELAGVQAEMEAWYPDRQVRLLDWDDDRQRFALRVTGGADPGRYFVYLRDQRRCIEFLRRDPELNSAPRSRQERFTYIDRQGRVRSARVTLPRAPVVSPPPIVALLPDAPWLEAGVLQDHIGPALAELGCLVLEVDHPFAHAAHRSDDTQTRRAPAEQAAADLAVALEYVTERHGGPRKRLTLVGIGYGGWLALRVAQLQPERVRAVVALNAFDTLDTLTRRLPDRELPNDETRELAEAKEVMDYLEAIRNDFAAMRDRSSGEEGTDATAEAQPIGTSRLAFQKRMMVPKEREPVNLPAELARRYFAPALADGGEPAVSAHADQLLCQVYLIHDADNPFAPPGDVRRLRRRLASAGREPEYWEAPTADWHRPLAERPEVWQQAGRYLLEALYRFDVEIGPAREVRP